MKTRPRAVRRLTIPRLTVCSLFVPLSKGFATAALGKRPRACATCRPEGKMESGHLLESRGVRVFSLAENCAEVDAYSVWRGPRPFVFLNVGKSGERRRFDAAHELAHLVLHRHAAPNGTEAEKDAHAFASAFLMPSASMKAIGRVVPNLGFIIEQKKRWIVSASAMC